MDDLKKENEAATRCEASAVELLVIPQIECCKCGWTGDETDMKKIPSPWLKKMGVEGSDNVCPKCEYEEFYRV